MVFSSIFFLYFFLPLTLLLYFLVGPRFRNYLLLGASLFFYAWGEMGYVLLMLFSITVNWLVGLGIGAARDRGSSGGRILAVGIILNLLPLAFFKYGNFLVDNLNGLLLQTQLGRIELAEVHLPIGISFFTFQAISYIVDIYRSEAQVQKNPAHLALYISLFPQLIAGPIVRYHDIAREIVQRRISAEDLRDGITRFVTGLAKKVLIANHLGALADHLFALPAAELNAGLAWLGIIAYTLQIYYDFSGYSDMAIGLGRMFGFHFLENFNYPYISASVSEFWRRWHISLSSWFRDYLYIPMGGNRVGAARNYFNLVAVFFLCGLWHGASWTFAAWGLYHGAFLVLERSPAGRLIDRLPRALRHFYTLIAVMVGWVFFRSDTLTKALLYLRALFDFSGAPYLDAKLFSTLNDQFYLALGAAIFFAMPVVPFLKSRLNNQLDRMEGPGLLILRGSTSLVLAAWMVSLIIYSSAELISGSHNPFLYFRF
ncbi:MAG: MBOAT family O-acyltransferase [Thermodesulfobacteriota bacterium]